MLEREWKEVYDLYMDLGFDKAAESLKEWRSDIKMFRRPNELARLLRQYRFNWIEKHMNTRT